MLKRLILIGFTLLWCAGALGQPHKYRKIQRYLDGAVHEGLSGVVILISDPNRGTWTGVAGYSKVETKEPMRDDRVFSLASIGKMYNAVAILKLAEDGKLRLDDRITKYLSKDITRGLPNGDRITIRHLLSHTAGLFNYESDPELTGLYFSGRLKLDTVPRIEVLRKYVFGKPALCEPGLEFHYSSTHYLLLAMVADAIVPGGHSEYLRQLLRVHNFKNTTYRQTPEANNVNYYGDLDQNGKAENLTVRTFETTNWFTGDDGVYAPIREAETFMRDLMHGSILNKESLAQMQTWNNRAHPDYGLGLMADKSFPYKFLIGHSGRGIGVTTDLYYFPHKDRVVAIFCNTGLRASAPEFRRAYNQMRTRIVKKLFLF